jgi:hypothetical protein
LIVKGFLHFFLRFFAHFSPFYGIIGRLRCPLSTWAASVLLPGEKADQNLPSAIEKSQETWYNSVVIRKGSDHEPKKLR